MNEVKVVVDSSEVWVNGAKIGYVSSLQTSYESDVQLISGRTHVARSGSYSVTMTFPVSTCEYITKAYLDAHRRCKAW